ncbi:hypothetical protein LguiB_016999 [Lonicera macranthoides]
MKTLLMGRVCITNSKNKKERKQEKRAHSGSGCWVEAYGNGYAYNGKYDGYGVETWARGSRYRGQYRQGL